MNDGFLKIIFDIATSTKRTTSINLTCVGLYLVIIPLYLSSFLPENILLSALAVISCAAGFGGLTGLLINSVIDGLLKLTTIIISQAMAKKNKQKKLDVLLKKNATLITQLNECYDFLSVDAQELLLHLSYESITSVDLTPVVQKLNMRFHDKKIYNEKKRKLESVKTLIENNFIIVTSKLQMNQHTVKLNPILSDKIQDIKTTLVRNFLDSSINRNHIIILFENHGSDSNTILIETLDDSFRTSQLHPFFNQSLKLDSTIFTFKYDYKKIFECLLGYELNDTVHLL
ncbi:hypothetical protein [Proteus terrae]|uniref:hypothetical protein n=1 Tax=Proteus terrae TaxID=1574161 RepID=UPI0018C5B887|nr:hypothetical protein [Proteus mirabilis]